MFCLYMKHKIFHTKLACSQRAREREREREKERDGGGGGGREEERGVRTMRKVER